MGQRRGRRYFLHPWAVDWLVRQSLSADIANGAVTANKLSETGVVAATYRATDLTVDAQGRITSAANGSISTSEIEDDAVTADKLDNTSVTAGSYTASEHHS